MSRIKTLDNIVNNVVKYFNDMIAEYRYMTAERREKYALEREKQQAEFNLHKKKYEYISELQYGIDRIIYGNDVNKKWHNNKEVISNADKIDGYFVVVGHKSIDAKTKTKCIRPNIKIELDAKSMDDMSLTMSEPNGDVIRTLHIKDDEDYKRARHSICDYLSIGQGSWILQIN